MTAMTAANIRLCHGAPPTAREWEVVVSAYQDAAHAAAFDQCDPCGAARRAQDRLDALTTRAAAFRYAARAARPIVEQGLLEYRDSYQVSAFFAVLDALSEYMDAATWPANVLAAYDRFCAGRPPSVRESPEVVRLVEALAIMAVREHGKETT